MLKCHIDKHGRSAVCHAVKRSCPIGAKNHVELKDVDSISQYNDLSGDHDDYSHLAAHDRATIIRRGALDVDQLETRIRDAVIVGDDVDSPEYVAKAVRDGDAAAMLKVCDTNEYERIPDHILDKAYERIIDDAAVDLLSRSGDNEEALQSIHTMFVNMRNVDVIDDKRRAWATYMAMKMERLPMHYDVTVGA